MNNKKQWRKRERKIFRERKKERKRERERYVGSFCTAIVWERGRGAKSFD